jgi:hypothetical protein
MLWLDLKCYTLISKTYWPITYIYILNDLTFLCCTLAHCLPTRIEKCISRQDVYVSTNPKSPTSWEIYSWGTHLFREQDLGLIYVSLQIAKAAWLFVKGSASASSLLVMLNHKSGESYRKRINFSFLFSWYNLSLTLILMLICMVLQT